MLELFGGGEKKSSNLIMLLQKETATMSIVNIIYLYLLYSYCMVISIIYKYL